MKVSKIYTCPECETDIDLTITLGDPMFFSPEKCPTCDHEIDSEEVEDITEEDEEWQNPFYK